MHAIVIKSVVVNVDVVVVIIVIDIFVVVVSTIVAIRLWYVQVEWEKVAQAIVSKAGSKMHIVYIEFSIQTHSCDNADVIYKI